MVHYLPRSSKVFPRRRREEPCTKVRILLDVPKSASGTADLLQGACLHRGDTLHGECTLLGLTYKQGNLFFGKALFFGQIPCQVHVAMPSQPGAQHCYLQVQGPNCSRASLCSQPELTSPVEVLETGASTGIIFLKGTWRGPPCHRLSADAR